MIMALHLTEQQRQAIEAQQGRPVEVVDPHTRQTYVLIAREQYERVRALLEQTAEQEPSKPSAIPPGILRSQQALRRELPQLLTQRKLQGKWVCYAGDERIGIASTKTALVRACLKRGLDDDAFYVGKIEPHQLIEEEELDPPSPFLMVEEDEGTHP